MVTWKLSILVNKEIVKKTVYNTIKAKVNNLEKKVSDGSTSVQTSKWIGDVESKIPDISGLATTDVLNIEISEVVIKISEVSK